MGTNYYARLKPCQHCGLSKTELHIGKSSAGWTFSFHAIDSWDHDVQIKSWPEWMAFLMRPDVAIYDEYDRLISLEKFLALVDSKRSEKHNHAKLHPEGCFLDDEGNSFSTHEFS